VSERFKGQVVRILYLIFFFLTSFQIHHKREFLNKMQATVLQDLRRTERKMR